MNNHEKSLLNNYLKITSRAPVIHVWEALTCWQTDSGNLGRPERNRQELISAFFIIRICLSKYLWAEAAPVTCLQTLTSWEIPIHCCDPWVPHPIVPDYLAQTSHFSATVHVASTSILRKFLWLSFNSLSDTILALGPACWPAVDFSHSGCVVSVYSIWDYPKIIAKEGSLLTAKANRGDCVFLSCSLAAWSIQDSGSWWNDTKAQDQGASRPQSGRGSHQWPWPQGNDNGPVGSHWIMPVARLGLLVLD